MRKVITIVMVALLVIIVMISLMLPSLFVEILFMITDPLYKLFKAIDGA